MTEIQDWEEGLSPEPRPATPQPSTAIEGVKTSGLSAPSLYLIDGDNRIWATELRLPPDIDLHSVREMARMGVNLMSGQKTDASALHVFVQVDLDRALGSLNRDAELLVIHREALDNIKDTAIGGAK